MSRISYLSQLKNGEEKESKVSTHMHKWINEWTYPSPAKSDTRFPKAAAKKLRSNKWIVTWKSEKSLHYIAISSIKHWSGRVIAVSETTTSISKVTRYMALNLKISK